jgi:hypothetical protein
VPVGYEFYFFRITNQRTITCHLIFLITNDFESFNMAKTKFKKKYLASLERSLHYREKLSKSKFSINSEIVEQIQGVLLQHIEKT